MFTWRQLVCVSEAVYLVAQRAVLHQVLRLQRQTLESHTHTHAPHQRSDFGLPHLAPRLVRGQNRTVNGSVKWFRRCRSTGGHNDQKSRQVDCHVVRYGDVVGGAQLVVRSTALPEGRRTGFCMASHVMGSRKWAGSALAGIRRSFSSHSAPVCCTVYTPLSDQRRTRHAHYRRTTHAHDTQTTYWLRWPVEGDARRLGLGLERGQACVDAGERGFVARGRGLAPDFEAGQPHVAAVLHCSRVRNLRRVAGARASCVRVVSCAYFS